MGQESETWVPLLAFSESHCFNLPQTCGLRMRPCKRFVVVSGSWTSCTLRPHIYIFNKHACSIMFQFDDFRHSNIMFHYRLGQPPVSDQRVCCVWIGFPGSGYGGRDQRWLPQISSQFHNRKVSVGTWGCSDHSEIVVLPDPCFLISSARAFCILLHLSQQKSFSFLSRLFWQVGKYTCKHYHSVVAKQSTQLRRYFTWAYLDVCPTMFVLYSNGSYNPAMMKPI